MSRDYSISPRDPLHPSNIVTAVLLGFAFSVYHRPHITEILPSYQAFDNLMPWSWWGWTALSIALLMLVTPRGSGWRLVAHAAAGTFWLAVAGAFASGVGVTSAVTTYTLLACVSGVLFARSAVYWQSHCAWWRRLVSDPPRWLRRLAQVGEFDPEGRESRG